MSAVQTHINVLTRRYAEARDLLMSDPRVVDFKSTAQQNAISAFSVGCSEAEVIRFAFVGEEAVIAHHTPVPWEVAQARALVFAREGSAQNA